MGNKKTIGYVSRIVLEVPRRIAEFKVSLG